MPPQYLVYITLVGALIAAYGRYNKGRQNGLSPLQAIMAVIEGTNTPGAKVLMMCLCVLTLSSCATTAAFLASPFGQATLQTADQLGKQVVLATEETGLQQIILQASAKVSALNAEGINADAVKETLRLSEIAGFAGVIEAAQVKYEQLTGKRFSLPKNPVKVTVAAESRERQNRLLRSREANPELHNVPACLQLAGGVPIYGERVAFVLSNGEVK